MGVDLLDMAVAFDEEQIVDFFDLDAADDEAKDDLFAVPLAYRVHDPVHGLVELFLCKRLGQVMGGPDVEGFDGEFVTCRQEDDFGLTFLFSHFTGDIGSQQAGHADIQQDDVEIFPFFHGVYKVHGVVIGVYFDIRGFVLVISLYGCFHDFQLVL